MEIGVSHWFEENFFGRVAFIRELREEDEYKYKSETGNTHAHTRARARAHTHTHTHTHTRAHTHAHAHTHTHTHMHTIHTKHTIHTHTHKEERLGVQELKATPVRHDQHWRALVWYEFALVCIGSQCCCICVELVVHEFELVVHWFALVLHCSLNMRLAIRVLTSI